MNETIIKNEIIKILETTPVYKELEYQDSFIQINKSRSKYIASINLSACFYDCTTNKYSEYQLDSFFKKAFNEHKKSHYFDECNLEITFKLFSRIGKNISVVYLN